MTSIKCFEFFNCNKDKCILQKTDKPLKCWEYPPHLTPCTDFGSFIDVENKLQFCKNCLYYEHLETSGKGEKNRDKTIKEPPVKD